MLFKYAFVIWVVVFNFSNTAIAHVKNKDQVIFERGVELMRSGECAAAIPIFENLNAKTGSARVKLEWARCAYIVNQLAVARQLFEEVKRSSPPMQVVEKIDEYLSLIKEKRNPISINLSLSYDDNPFLLPNIKTIYIHGIPFSYVPDKPKGAALGVRLNGSYLHSISDIGGAYAIMKFDHTQYNIDSSTNKTRYAVGLRFDNFLRRDQSVSSELFRYYEKGILTQDGEELIIEGIFRDGINESDGKPYFLKLGNYKFPSSPSSNYRQYSAGITMPMFVKSMSVAPYLSVSVSDSLLKQDSYNFIEAGAKFIGYKLNWHGVLPQFEISHAVQKYKSMDTLFLKQRLDNTTTGAISFKLPLSLGDTETVIKIGVEKKASNISVFGYTNYFFNLAFNN